MDEGGEQELVTAAPTGWKGRARTGTRVAVGAAALAPPIVAGVFAWHVTSRLVTVRRSRTESPTDVPVPELSLACAASLALDSLVTMPIALLSSLGSAEHYDRSSAELDAAVRFYDEAGWLDDPAERLPAPTSTPHAVLDPTACRGGIETLRFASGWLPADGEPGGERWAGFMDNRSVTVRLLRHAGGPRPWLIAIHGQGMGRPSDHRMLRARRLHEELGLNVALPVLPLHGPRAAGVAPDQQFVSGVYPVNNVLGLAQSVWDIRRLLLWLRDEQRAPAVGVLGLSLGSYVTGLLSTVEPDLACVVALVPTSDLAAALRDARPALPSKRGPHDALYDERATRLLRVVSPLASPCLVSHDRRFIVAGTVDQVASPDGAAELWRHWDRPSILWRDRGHVTTGMSREYDAHLDAILTTTGLSPRVAAG